MTRTYHTPSHVLALFIWVLAGYCLKEEAMAAPSHGATPALHETTLATRNKDGASNLRRSLLDLKSMQRALQNVSLFPGVAPGVARLSSSLRPPGLLRLTSKGVGIAFGDWHVAITAIMKTDDRYDMLGQKGQLAKERDEDEMGARLAR